VAAPGRIGVGVTLAAALAWTDTLPPIMRVLLCRPRGFCAGVERAIEAVERALQKFGPPIYVRHEIVHNKVVVEDLRGKGAVFVDELTDVPQGAHVIFSAHGVAPQVFDEADSLQLHRIDATCPLVTKVHAESKRFARAGDTILLIGHREHVEVIGVVGEAPDRTIVVATPEEAETVEVPDPEKIGVLTQTTLSVDEMNAVMSVLRRRFPALKTPRKEDICYATTNRQMAVKDLAGKVDVWLVIGDPTSSNSNRLRELGESQGVPAHLLLDSTQLDPAWVAGRATVGVTSGASTPEVSVAAVVARLRELGATSVEEVDGALETVEFTLPLEVR
jgi:4-hydroxy-3-methylbut-2-enyl diphosphate reductase